MKVCTCVELAYGVINKMSAFPSFEAGMEYFNKCVPPQEAENWSEVVYGTNFAHAIDNEDSDYEIYMEMVEMEG